MTMVVVVGETHPEIKNIQSTGPALARPLLYTRTAVQQQRACPTIYERARVQTKKAHAAATSGQRG